jgi:hypothetical protein
MAISTLKSHLSNKVVTLTSQISLKSSPLLHRLVTSSPVGSDLSPPSPLVFQITYLYDKYNPKNTQHAHREHPPQQPHLHPFRITSTTHLILNRPGDDVSRHAQNSSISRWFYHLMMHEPVAHTLRGYLSSLIQLPSPPSSSRHLPPISSLLLVGPSGSGKSSLLQQKIESFLPQNLITLIRISLGTLQPYSDTALVQALNSALVRQPCVILLDNLEYLIPNTNKNNGYDTETSHYVNMNTVRDSCLSSRLSSLTLTLSSSLPLCLIALAPSASCCFRFS